MKASPAKKGGDLRFKPALAVGSALYAAHGCVTRESDASKMVAGAGVAANKRAMGGDWGEKLTERSHAASKVEP